MSKMSNQKEKLLYLMRFFLEETDEMHPLSRKRLEELLGEYGIHSERKSLYNDIETLRRFGMDIAYQKEQPEGYYLATHDFELAELKLLVDAVQSSRFITEKKSFALIHKIEGLASRHEAKQLQRQVVVSDRIKAMNESIYYNVDKLHAAIACNQQIQFHYFGWTVDKQIHLKKDGSHYIASPWALTWNEENYYLIGYDEEAKLLKHFRVDKMLDIFALDLQRVGREEFARFDLAHYSKKTFGMFGGEEKTLRIKFDNKYIGVVIDRFGKDVYIRPETKDSFVIRTTVVVSEPFFGWLTGLGKGVKILSPESTAEAYREHLQGIMDAYGNKC